ncbi:tetratricopeptide repeat protein [Micromonospora sp. bgisy143]|uniref:tetratricopeptide repeat protein n=1 Tax=Micromonospora sp. bgisy143 TaxID=3413790 RepID=UPI003EB8E102
MLSSKRKASEDAAIKTSPSAKIDDSIGVQIGDFNTQYNHLPTPPSPNSVNAPGGTHNLPRPATTLFGRDLESLDDLVKNCNAAIGQAVYGLGGVGKTELALHFAYSRIAKYTLVWWINAETQESIKSGLAELTYRLCPAIEVARADAWGIGWLQSHEGWLIVLDNVEDPQHISALIGNIQDKGRVLITTRRNIGAGRWSRLGLKSLHLGPLARAASTELLIALTEKHDHEAAARLAAALGDLPIALEQAASYISQNNGMTFDQYTELIRSRFARIASVAGEGGDIERTVARVWTVTMEAITQRSSLAAQLLLVAAHFAPDNIPEEILFPLASDPLDLAEALSILASYSMVNRHAGTLSVHRLVQAVTRAAAAAGSLTEGPPAYDRAADLALAAFTTDPTVDIDSWPRWRLMVPHIEAISHWAPIDHESRSLTILLSMSGAYLQGQGNLAAAIAMSERAYSDCRRILGTDDPNRLAVTSNLARCYELSGKSRDAIELLRSISGDVERILDQDDPYRFSFHNNLAKAYQSMGDLAQAVSLFERTLADRIRVLGEDDYRVMISRSNLAYAYQQAGRLSEAARLHEVNLTARRQSLGDTHPMTLNSKHGLALALSALGKLQESIIIHEETVEQRSEVLGETHPDTLRSRISLADDYRTAGRLSDAINIYESVYEIQRRSLGEANDEAALTAHNLALAHLDSNEPLKAVVILEDLTAIRDSSRPGYVEAKLNLALAYSAIGRKSKAIRLLDEILPTSRRAWGHRHPLTRAVLQARKSIGAGS